MKFDLNYVWPLKEFYVLSKNKQLEKNEKTLQLEKLEMAEAERSYGNLEKAV